MFKMNVTTEHGEHRITYPEITTITSGNEEDFNDALQIMESRQSAIDKNERNKSLATPEELPEGVEQLNPEDKPEKFTEDETAAMHLKLLVVSLGKSETDITKILKCFRLDGSCTLYTLRKHGVLVIDGLEITG